MTTDPAERPDAPAIRIHGSATSEEVAAVVAVLLAGADGGAPDTRRPASTWASRRGLLRGRHDPGPSAWRTTYRGRG